LESRERRENEENANCTMNGVKLFFSERKRVNRNLSKFIKKKRIRGETNDEKSGAGGGKNSRAQYDIKGPLLQITFLKPSNKYNRSKSRETEKTVTTEWGETQRCSAASELASAPLRTE